MRSFSVLLVLAIVTSAAADVPVVEKLRDLTKKDSKSSGGSTQKSKSTATDQKGQQDRYYDGQRDKYYDKDQQSSGSNKWNSMGAKNDLYYGNGKTSGNNGPNGQAKTISVCTKLHNSIGGVPADSDSTTLYTCDRNNLATDKQVGSVQYICYPGTNPDASGKRPQTQVQQECSNTLHIKGNDVTYWQTYDPVSGNAGPAEFGRDLQTGRFEDLHFVMADYVIEAGKSLLPVSNPNFDFYNVGELYRLHYFGKTFQL